MDVCAAYQVPHSVFLGWSKLDREKAIWHHVRKKTTCPSCGTHADEWDETAGGDRFAYVAVKKTCRGCQVLDSARDLSKNKENGHGVHLVLTRKEAL